MNDRGFRRWALLGALASTALLAPACQNQEWPEAGREYEGVANESQDLASFREDRPGELPATGGSGTPRQAPAAEIDWSAPQQRTAPGLGQAVRDGPGPQDAFGVHGSQNGIGAPGYSTPQVGTALSGGDRVMEGSSQRARQPQDGRLQRQTSSFGHRSAQGESQGAH